MSESADFADAFSRHWEDGELLLGRNRWANADHLYGLAAECGLKCVMVHLGMGVDKSGKPLDPKHRVHVNDLWGSFVSFAQAHSGQMYASRLVPNNPFQNWSIHQRYAHRRHFSSTGTAAHRQGADLVRRLLFQFALDRGIAI